MSFSLYVGSIVYGGFGTGAQEASVVVPLNSGESNYCDYVDRKFFMSNGACDGCGGSNPHEWDVQQIRISGGIDGGLRKYSFCNCIYLFSRMLTTGCLHSYLVGLCRGGVQGRERRRQ